MDRWTDRRIGDRQTNEREQTERKTQTDERDAKEGRKSGLVISIQMRETPNLSFRFYNCRMSYFSFPLNLLPHIYPRFPNRLLDSGNRYHLGRQTVKFLFL